MTDSLDTAARRPHILSVDDDPDVQRVIHLFLSKNGYDVSLASSAADALSKLRDVHPDLILLDVMMPEMSGYEFCESLQKNEQTAQIPVVFVTALGEDRDRARAFALGAADYLIKPIMKDDILEKVSSQLKRKARWTQASTGSTSLEERAKRQFDFNAFKSFLCSHLSLDDDASESIACISHDMLYEACGSLNISSNSVAQIVAEFVGVPCLGQINPGDLMLGILPIRFCLANHVVALGNAAGDLAFAMSDPFDRELLDVLARYCSRGERNRIIVTQPAILESLCSPSELTFNEQGLAENLDLTESTSGGEDGAAVSLVLDLEEESDAALEHSASKASVVKLASQLLARALQAGASDLHVEPRANSVGVRYRVDGVLAEVTPVPKRLGPALISRLKIMAQLDISKRRIPQDGRIRISYMGREMDLRVSTLPTRFGESVVVRFMVASVLSLHFEALGFEGDSLRIMNEGIRKPGGMLLVTGPTGSGKTTTLYSALQALNQPEKNLVTVEDPIENEIHRVRQVQIHPEAGLTFPVALRAILRQDPDIIMVGEIRDLETADIAIKSALTGHLILSTLHTNDVPSTIVRLINMGIPSFLVASTLEMVVSQRLLRRLCPSCKQPTEVPRELLESAQLRLDGPHEFYEENGCDECRHTGYKGRFAAIEILAVDDQMRHLITSSPSSDALRSYATTQCGMRTLQQDALLKAARGLTTVGEVQRTVG